jgi:DNA-nicking Smr family endonuclease
MARKKGDKTSRRTDMQNNPFKHLKGFSVSAAEKKPAEARTKPTACPAIKEEPASFSEAMTQLGVQRMAKPDQILAPQAQKEERSVLPVSPGNDEELFEAAMGKLDTVFVDQYPDDEPLNSSPRRMKQLLKGKLVIEASLDLHGLTRLEAREKVHYFLENSVYHGMKTVLIVTGWGRSSDGEPVLRGDIEKFLDGEGRTWVAEWARAPKKHGGEGALVAFLRAADKIL